jgi:hypothetical protein
MASGPDPFDFGNHGDDPFAPASAITPAASVAGGQPDRFGMDTPPPAAAGADVLGQPPVLWLVLGLVAAALGAAAAAVLGTSSTIAFGAWAASGPLAIGLLAVFALLDTRQRARPVYNSPVWAPVLYWSVIAVAALGIGLSAWRIAEWAGQL